MSATEMSTLSQNTNYKITKKNSMLKNRLNLILIGFNNFKNIKNYCFYKNIHYLHTCFKNNYTFTLTMLTYVQ